jgi:branched-subunit amino acid aminotransferase/4-amino-4-deoxychorismate lyase
LSDARLKIIAFREGADGPSPLPGLKAEIIITAAPIDDKTKLSYEKGIRGHIVSIKRNNYSPISFIKSLNYLDNILGRIEARENNADEAIFLNIQGRVAEGSTSNIFIIKQGTVFTPPVTEGILNGITRDVIFRISSEIGIKCLEIEFPPGQLFEADESFLTNSLMEIMPLVSVNGKPVGTGNPGEITKTLMDRYCQVVAQIPFR